LTVASSTSGVRGLAEFCAEGISGLFDAKEAAMLEIAVVEGANNAVRHGYALEGGHPIELEMRHLGQGVEFILRDEGKAFDPATVSEPVLEWEKLEDVPEGGWGVFLIHSIMDEMEYGRYDKINFLRMVKRLPGAPVDEPIPPISTSQPDVSPISADTEDKEKENEMALDEMAEELSTAYENLNLFYSLSRDAALVSDLEVFLENTLERILAVVPNASWGVIRLKKGEKLRLEANTPECPDEALVLEIPFDDDSIEARATATSNRVFADDYKDCPGRVMCLPIVGLDEFLGTILVGKDPGSDLFTAGDAKLARAMADQIAVSIENNRLYSKAIAAEIAERELGIARELQRKLILKRLPEIDGLRCHVISTTAEQVGGDYATLRKMEDGTVYLAVCDAMGKGMSASYFSLMSHVAFHSVVEQQHVSGVTPGGILTLMNRIMANDFDVFGMFTTAIIAKIDPGSDRILYASAGHCPPVIQTPDGEIGALDTVDFMLGVDKDTEYADLAADFPPGTRLLFYSDGLTDVMERGSDETLGIMPLLQACGESFGKNDIKTACEQVFEAILLRVGGEFDDDVSIIGVERTND